MSRTVFVNPGHSRKRRKKRRRSHGIVRRRNAGITPFTSNPLILSNPRRRRRHSNPIGLPNIQGVINSVLSGGGGAALALAANMLGASRIENEWARRGVQVAVAAVGGALLSKKSQALGAAFTGAAMMAPIQDLAADVLGIGVAAGLTAPKDADLDALAADLEDVLDEMDDDLGDDDDDDDVW